MISDDTIVAISSASGPALRMIVRLCGADARAIAGRLWIGPLPGAREAQWGRLDLAGMQVPAWCCSFVAPHSYAGQDTVELHIPGNPLLAKLLTEALLAAGARAAEPGEFTARAYFNGRLTLTEAEGVAAAVSASNERQLAAARRLMAGELHARVAPLSDQLADTLALLEVGIDFSDEEVTLLPPEVLLKRIAGVDADLGRLLDQSSRIESVPHEPTVVLIGRPNAGKSTLLNALAEQERAVVSPIAGTTRDAISARVALPLGMIRLVDVAGLEEQDEAARHVPTNQASGAAELRRISLRMRERALKEAAQADRVVLVREAGDARPPLVLEREPDLSVMSKSDLALAEAALRGGKASAPEGASLGAPWLYDSGGPDPLRVSALTGTGLSDLRESLNHLCFGDSSASSALALGARHVGAIGEARQALAQAASRIDDGAELIAVDLRDALAALGSITGRVTADDLLGRIFSAFCIGK